MLIEHSFTRKLGLKTCLICVHFAKNWQNAAVNMEKMWMNQSLRTNGSKLRTNFPSNDASFSRKLLLDLEPVFSQMDSFHPRVNNIYYSILLIFSQVLAYLMNFLT